LTAWEKRRIPDELTNFAFRSIAEICSG
jgi:hypothetical protein